MRYTTNTYTGTGHTFTDALMRAERKLAGQAADDVISMSRAVNVRERLAAQDADVARLRAAREARTAARAGRDMVEPPRRVNGVRVYY